MLIPLLMGLLLGFLAGLGVGGGSLLILWLTLVVGIPQPEARWINLAFFLTAAGAVSIFRWKKGQLQIKKLLPAILAGSIAAGVFSLSDTAKLLRIRGDAMQSAVPYGVGGMAAVLGLSYKDVGALVEACSNGDDICVAANDNSDGQVVLSGSMIAIDKAVEIASEFGARKCVKLAVSAPFHSPFMAPAANTMARAFMEVEANNAQIPLVANVLASPITDYREIIKNLVEQVTGTVRWRETMNYFQEQSITDLVELGAGKVLSGIAKRSNKEINSISVGSIEEIEELAKNL